MLEYDYLIAGGGIIGLAIARELKKRFPDKSVCIIEKEADVAFHSSGRNSGVLHAGFYYTADSLKAKFTKEGNRAMKEYCQFHNLPVNECGKLVVATNEEELEGLKELKRRGDQNGVELHWIDEDEVFKIDPNAMTFQKALYSPTTASVDPIKICKMMREELLDKGVDFHFRTKYRKKHGNVIKTNHQPFHCHYFINAAGLYADKIAKDFNFGKNYTIIPFRGNYLKYNHGQDEVKTNIYPVPNLKNPFLGVHFTKTVDGTVKIGPTATPAFWRENYHGWKRFKLEEFVNIIYFEAKLFLKNAFHFRRLAFEEIKKYRKKHFVNLATGLVKHLNSGNFEQSVRPGIRAQLLNKETLELVQDFVIEGDHQSIHILNAVSPGFTCSIPFASYVVEEMMKKQKGDGMDEKN
ncbi:L-2-hydroxyglutarate oxidase [Bacillus paramycoides]|uniref:L-2-hydroxyglutarate oxidase n=1 Tax=Bacillus paramycoides TaxID=2026194 RepID=UPI003D0168A6